MRDSLLAFAQHFFDCSREIKGLRGRFCSRDALSNYSFFWPMYVCGLKMFMNIGVEQIEDNVGSRSGYLITNKDFKSLSIN